MNESRGMNLKQMLHEWASGSGPMLVGEQHLRPEELSEYEAGLVGESKSREIRAHLAHCPDCLRELACLEVFLESEAAALELPETRPSILNGKTNPELPGIVGQEPPKGLNGHSSSQVEGPDNAPGTAWPSSRKKNDRGRWTSSRRRAIRLSLAAGLLLATSIAFIAPWGRPSSHLEISYEAGLARLKGQRPPLFEVQLTRESFDLFLTSPQTTRNSRRPGPRILFPREGITSLQPEIHFSLDGLSVEHERRYLVQIIDGENGDIFDGMGVSLPGQSYVRLPYPGERPLSPGSYALSILPVSASGKILRGEPDASGRFVVYSERQVAEIRRAAPRSGNQLLDRQLLAAHLLDAKDEDGYPAGLAYLALEELGEFPADCASLTARARHLLLRVRASEALARVIDIQSARQDWQELDWAP